MDTSTDAKQAYELTRNPVDGTYGFICLEHGVHRRGLAERHARNVEAKHIREDHSEAAALTLDLQLQALAQHVVAARHNRDFSPTHATVADTAMTLWGVLTDLPEAEALTLAEKLADPGTTVPVAFVPPF